MITPLLHQVYDQDIDLWVEGNKLKYRTPAGVMTDELKRLLADKKDDILERLYQNLLAVQQSWTVFDFGEMYTKQIHDQSHIFIFRNVDDTFTVWRGTWKSGVSCPIGEKTILEQSDFTAALDRANQYYEWAIVLMVTDDT